MGVVLFFSLCISCKEKDSYTPIFSEYLSHEFEIEIPKETHYFVLLSKISCQGCIQTAQKLLVSRLILQPELLNKVTFIYSDKIEANPLLTQKVVSYYDSFEALDQLPLLIDNMIVVKTENTVVQNWTFIELDNIPEVIKTIR